MTRPNGDSINTVSSQGFEGRQGSSGELPGANVEGDTLHSRFYHFVSLKVETTLFRVPRFILENYSAKCRQILKSTTPSGHGEGEVQIQLADIRAIDFERFLSVLLPADIGQYDVSSLDEWISILEVAHTLECPSVRKLAINQITSLASAVDKVVLGHKYDVPVWVTEGYIELCQRKASISSEEGRRLGLDDVVHISNIRFQLISTQTGARIQAASLLRFCFGPKRHLLGTNRVIDFIAQAKRHSNNDSEHSTEPIDRMYTPSYGNFFVWLTKRDAAEQPFEPLAFKEVNLDTFATTGPDIENVPYAMTVNQDESTNLQLQSISCMATYSHYSLEEIRFCDYRQGRKVAEEVPHIESPQPSHMASRPTPFQPFGGFAGLTYSATPSPTAYSNTNSWRQSSNGGGKKNKRR